VTVAGRPGRITADPVATATFLPSASNTSEVPIAMLRPRWITVPRATRSRPSGETGRRPGPPATVLNRPGPPATVMNRPGPPATVLNRPGPPATVLNRPGPPATARSRAGACS